VNVNTSKLKVLAGSAIAATSILFSATTHAGMQDQMESMFGQMTNVTAPGTFQTQTRGGIAFGGVTMRTPIIDQNVVTWVPPSAAGGCGGIDLNGGSFSFIDSQQIVNTLQKVAANAEGYAFQLALDAVYPEAAAWIETFQKKMQAMNQYLGNSCQMAQGLVDGGVDAWKNRDNNEFKSFANVTGAASDFYDTMTSNWTPKDSKESPETAAMYEERRGNLVYRAIQEGQVMDAFPDGDQDMAEHILSLIGVFIRPRETQTGSIDNTNGAGDKLGLEVTVTEESAHLFTLEQFVLGSMTGDFASSSAPAPGATASPLQVYRCGSSADDIKFCEEPTVENSDFEGFSKLIETTLLGDGTSPGIITKLQTNVGNYTNIEQGVALSMPKSQFAQVRNLSLKAPNAVRGFAREAARSMALESGFELAQKAIKETIAGVSSLQAVGKEQVKEKLEKRLADLQGEYDRLRAHKFSDSHKLTQMYKDIMELTSSEEYVRLTEQN